MGLQNCPLQLTMGLQGCKKYRKPEGKIPKTADMILRIHNPVAARVDAYNAVRLIPVIPRSVARKTVNEKPVALRRRLRTRCPILIVATEASSSALEKWAEDRVKPEDTFEACGISDRVTDLERKSLLVVGVDC